MYETFQLVALGILAAVLGLSWLSRRFPRVGWLQLFRYAPPGLSEEQRDRIRRRANIHAGVELIGMGLLLPVGYILLTVMFFNEFTTTGIVLAGLGSILLIVLGVTAIWTNRGGRRPPP